MKKTPLAQCFLPLSSASQPHDAHPPTISLICAFVFIYATLLPLLGLPPPLDLSLLLSVLELWLEFSAPPSCECRGLLISWLAGLTSRGLSEDCYPYRWFVSSSVFTVTTIATPFFFSIFIVPRGKTHTSLLAHLLFLAVGVRGAGVESGVVLTGGCVVGAGFAVFGRFGVDAVFVLGVFARVAERGGGGEEAVSG